ncbi:MAG: beta-lactamase family protein [Anaerolineales bacterium]|nr:beta-lactamase family protein [Anaerolineales bacterium]
MSKLLSLGNIVTMMAALMMLPALAAPVTAQADEAAPGGPGTTAPAPGLGPTDAAELEAFLEHLLAQEMAEYHIAGAAVAVVKDGQLFFAKGYGYANLDNGLLVDPEQTLFGIGSVTKLFTWTAVMQLVEQGKLDLDADINTYLDFRIPDTYPEPITLKHLLTHTSGFENRLFGMAASDASDVPRLPAREYLSSPVWPRVNPPGAYVNYSNYNAILAGYIIARVSGQPYDQYIQEHIFDPLGMVHATAQNPVPPGLRPFVSAGYTYTDGDFQVFPDYAGHPAGTPSGFIHASVTDVARFMIAHLQGGFYGDAAAGVRILEESTTQQMHGTLYTPDPHLLGVAYGFFDWSDNGQRTLAHRGYLPPMHSTLLLLPEQNLGVFVIYNSEGARRVANQHTGFQRAFFDHYYPASPVEPIQPPADFAERAGRLVGRYRSTEGSGTTAFKFVGLMEEYEISDPGDGTLLFSTPAGEWRFVEVEPLYFRQVDDLFGLAFREDNRGHITHLFFDRFPNVAFEKLVWYETRGFHMGLALGSVLIFLSVIPAGLLRFIRDRRPSRDRKPAPRGAHVAHGVILGISVLNLLFLVGFALGVPELERNILLDPPLIMKLALGLGVLSAVLTAGALVYTVLAWKNRYWGIAGRGYYTLVTVAAVAFVWFLNYWNLLGWRY